MIGSPLRFALAGAALALALPLPERPTPSRASAREATRAVPVDSAIFKSYRWRSIGPDRGGRSIAVSGVKGRPKEAYFGATGGGLWKTTDAGETWTPVTDGKIGSASVGAVAVSESNPDVVYIGMGESCIRGNIMPGDGVYKSTDAGKTWTHVGFSNSDAIARIIVDPTNPDVVYVASFGKYGGPSEERGVFKSTDGGKTWKRTLFRDARSGAVDISLEPQHPNVLYAALWEAYRNEWSMSSGGAGSGIYKSVDGGEHWTEITRNNGLPSGIDGRIGIDVSPANPNRVYALVENEKGGLFRSDDAGATWTLVNADRNIRQRAFYYTHVTADPKNADLVYLLNVSAYRSPDGGKTLQPLGGAQQGGGQAAGGTHGDNHQLWVDPDDPQHMILANDGGGAMSYNAGRTWSAEDYPTGQFYHVLTTSHVPFHVCGSQQDANEQCVPYSPPAGGGGFGRRQQTAEVYSPGGSEDGYIASDPLAPDVFYSGTNANGGGFLTKLDRRTGQTREVSPYPRMFSGEESAVIKERWQWTYPIQFSPVNPRVLYASSQHLWKTIDGGESWQRISPDLTRHDPKTMGPSGGPITRDMNGPEVYAVIFALAPSKRTEQVIWTGSDDGLVHV
ncbi:MAG: glycosyl hydrolase, partial [Gemmatirosa sp.]|nr:glycosyl hydrolase [Gemmatirosa sp.]